MSRQKRSKYCEVFSCEAEKNFVFYLEDEILYPCQGCMSAGKRLRMSLRWLNRLKNHYTLRKLLGKYDGNRKRLVIDYLVDCKCA